MLNKEVIFEKLMDALDHPATPTVGGALLGAGLSTLGNRDENKDSGRVISEAIGAGALGGLMGRLGKSVGPLSSPRTYKAMGASVPQMIPAMALGVGGVVAGGGLGGLIGGGVSNVADLVGIPGFNTNTGSSNTPGAKASMQAQSSAQPLDPRLAYGSPVDEYSAYISSQYPYA